jgi:tryptophanyl-tRNA synthetase
VGLDQLPHLELSREIARRFNHVYGPVLAEPHPLLTQTPKVPGTDGRKMSKSYGNTVDIYETPETLSAKVMSMYTDKTKVRANDPGHPEPCEANPPGCTVFALHKLYNPGWEARQTQCRAGKIGCVVCKKDLLKSLEDPFTGLRKARESSRSTNRTRRSRAPGPPAHTPPARARRGIRAREGNPRAVAPN